MGLTEDAVDSMFPELEDLRRFERAASKEGTDSAVKRERERLEKMPPGERTRKSLTGPRRIGAELAQAKLIRAVYSERQLQEVMTDFWFNHFNVFIGKNADRWWTTSYEYQAIRPHALGKFRDLLGATASHPAMLFYLDNWLSSAPGAVIDRRVMERYATRAIREQGLPPGGVATLLLRDRGMDTSFIESQISRRNARLLDPRRGNRRPASRDPDDVGPQRKGLNENYARELLELHTLGVDGGYSQQDIIDVARCFTGWTLLPLHAGQQFVYVPEQHDKGKKIVLGHRIKGKGIEEGREVLDLLAAHPSTARFISTKLARRFVSDDPPPALVERMARTFLESEGDIRRVLRTLFSSEEFWSPEALKAKVKTPFEFVASAARATGAEIAGLPQPEQSEGPMVASADARPPAAPGLLRALITLGQPLYGAQPPTGYKDTAEAWVSSGALLNRMKVALGIAANRIPGVRVDPPAEARRGDSSEMIATLGLRLTGREPDPATIEAVRRQLDLDPEQLDDLDLPRWILRSRDGRARLATGWLLASPEFQRR